jgi:uncharacterized tellurite resistance protein B-like protein
MFVLFIYLRRLVTEFFQAGGGGDYGGGGGGFGGGGGGFGGGGFGGSSYSGSGHGSSNSSIDSLIVIFWVTWVIYVVYLTFADGSRRVITRTIRQGRKMQQMGLMQNAIAWINSADAKFSQPVFLERVTLAFRTIQECWSRQDLRGCRAFISDSVHERFQLYLEMQKSEGIRHRIDDLKVHEATLVAVHWESQFDTIHVMFVASAMIAEERLDQASAKRTEIPRKEFSEVWSFSRRHGAVTHEQKSVLAGQCPHCGVMLTIEDEAQCSHCNSYLNSGYDDWVLAEITQDCEWLLPDSASSIPGWNELISADPGLSIQQLEDRASVVLWRCLLSLYFHKPQMAEPVLFRGQPEVPEPWRVPEDGFWRRPAMGSVQVLRCHPGSSAEDFDRVVVLLRWSGTKATGKRSAPKLVGDQTIYSNEVTLIRRRGAQSKIESAFSSFRCRSCGASINVAGSASCRFCNKSLNDGTYDWVVEAVDSHQPFSDAHLPQSTEESELKGWQLNPQWLSVSLQPLDSLTISARMLLSDGELAKAEKEFLRQLSQRQEISEDRLEECIAAAKSSTDDILLPGDIEQVRLLMKDLMRVAFVDGRVTSGEMKMLKKLSGPLNWSNSDVRQAVGRTRKELVRELRAAGHIKK